MPALMLSALPMPRALRITLWTLGSLVLILGLGVLWVSSELKPEPLGQRIAALLQSSNIKGHIQRVEASLAGDFSAEGVDLILEDGTAFQATTIKGQVDLVATLLGQPTLNNFSAQGLGLNLSQRKVIKTFSKKPQAESEFSLPTFNVGPFTASGQVTREDGKLITFKIEGKGLNSAGEVDLHASASWPGLKIGATETKPQLDLSLQAQFQRPFGQHGFSLTEMVRDLKTCKIICNAKDAASPTTGNMSLLAQGQRDASGNLVLTGILNDAAEHPAAKFSLTEKNSELKGEASLELDPAKFGALVGVLPNCSVAGKISVSARTDNTQDWQALADLQMKWPELSSYSPRIRAGLDSTWRIKSAVAGSAQGLDIRELSVSGNGINLNLNQPFQWKPGAELDGISVSLAARDAELATLAPLLTATRLVPTQGRWTGEAALSLNKGDIKITTLRTHALTGLTVEREGKVIAQNLSAEIPLRSEDGALAISPFKIDSPAGNLAKGEARFKLEKNSDWALSGKFDLGVAEIASQSNVPDLPIEKLRNTRIEALIELRSTQSVLTLQKLEAKILRQDLELFKLKSLQALKLDGTTPSGILFEAVATKLPLESLSVLVPGLNLSGFLNQANLIGGFQSEGFFIQTKDSPIDFSNLSLTWNQTPQIRNCDLSARLDLLFGTQKSRFNVKDIKVLSQGKPLATGDLSVGLNEAAANIKVRGDLSAIAQQPFAQAASNLAGGSYEAQLNRDANGEFTTSLLLTGVSFKDRPAKIKSLSLEGALVQKSKGFQVEGKCQADGSGVTSGKFSIQNQTSGTKSNWQVEANFDSIAGDDFLALFNSGTKPQPVTVAQTPTPADRLPLWHDHTGTVKVNIVSASAKGLVAEKVFAQLDITENQVALTQLRGKIVEGTLSGTGNCTFKPSNPAGPYLLNAQVGLQQFNFNNIAQAYPALKDFVQGKGDVNATADGAGNNLEHLLLQMSVNANLLSKNGRIQAFGAKESATAVSASKAGQTAELIGGIAKLAGAFTKNKAQGEKIARAGAAMSAASKLQQSLSDFAYDVIDVQVQRLPNGTVKINQGLIKNSELTINALGQITAQAGNDFNDWPLALQANMQGKGNYAEHFKLLGFAGASAETDGFTQGPRVQFSGSLNNLQNDLKNRLQEAVKNIQSGGGPRETAPAESSKPPASSSAAPIPNPLELLFKN